MKNVTEFDTWASLNGLSNPLQSWLDENTKRSIEALGTWRREPRINGTDFMRAMAEAIKPITNNKTEETNMRKLTVKKVIYNAPATIVQWQDGTRTVVKCGENEKYDAEKGLVMCIIKKMLGNEGNYYNQIRDLLPDETGKRNNTVASETGAVTVTKKK